MSQASPVWIRLSAVPIRRLIAGMLLCLAAGAAQAADIAVVLPGETALTREFVEALRERRPDDHVFVALLETDSLPAPSADFIVTMGQRSLAWRLTQPEAGRTIATYVTATSVEATEAQLPGSVQVLLASPKPERQLALAELVVPRLKVVGLLHSAATASQILDWRQAAENLQLGVATAQVNEAATLARRVVEVLDASDALVAPDDPAVYNADNLTTILLTSYARNKVLIGPSAPFIAAGSLSTTFSNPEQMAASVDRLLDQAWRPSAVHYPERFSVLSNHQVARSLGLPLFDDEQLADELRRKEQQP